MGETTSAKVFLELPPRTWAALDATLEFFRRAPGPPSADPFRQACQQLHAHLAQIGIQGCFRSPAQDTAPRPWYLATPVSRTARVPRRLCLSEDLVMQLVRICFTILEVQGDLVARPLVEHELEELTAVAAFLSAVRCQCEELFDRAPPSYGQFQIRWDDQRGQYFFADQVGRRVFDFALQCLGGLN
ncbi:MAG: hypothetical protein C4297_05300 [Gemmataceae bacterium]